MSECEKDVVPKYRGNPLVDFEAGVGLDLRVKLACELLKSAGLWGAQDGMLADHLRSPAALALDTATDLLELAAARGLLYPLPDHDDLSGPLKRHISRNAKAAVYQQTAQQRAAREEFGGVMPVGATAFPG